SSRPRLNVPQPAQMTEAEGRSNDGALDDNEPSGLRHTRAINSVWFLQKGQQLIPRQLSPVATISAVKSSIERAARARYAGCQKKPLCLHPRLWLLGP